jgi:hypothetical protein
METSPLPTAKHADPSLIPSTYYLRRRAHRLGITDSEFDACKTIGALQRLAKVRYRALAMQYHPDKRIQQPRQEHAPNLTKGTPLRGTMFKFFTEAYQCLMALPSTTALHRRPHLGKYPRYPQDTLSVETIPVPETSLPWALERRPLTLGFGWQETHP